MRLNELTEALDNSYPFQWVERSSDTWVAYADLPGDSRSDEDATLRITADQANAGPADDAELGNSDARPVVWELSFMTGYKSGKTGAGDQFRIFATVVAALRDWWAQSGSKTHIDEIEFTADKGKDGPSRAKLYKRFMQQMAKEIGWDMDVKSQSYNDLFILYNPRTEARRETYYKKTNENFKDGKNPGRKGLSKRVGIPANATLAQLEKIAKNSDGEKRRMAQWQLNMRRGKNK
jgi:hypothetical protein|tara:strand:+ start:2522 stop:3226 length:705 start_codon:yes stop_codon:yes gene_type:complete